MARPTAQVSTGGGGGFVSVRTKNFEPKLDLGAYQGLQLRLKGDDQRYKCIIRTDSNWDGIGFCKCVQGFPPPRTVQGLAAPRII